MKAIPLERLRNYLVYPGNGQIRSRNASGAVLFKATGRLTRAESKGPECVLSRLKSLPIRITAINKCYQDRFETILRGS